jgi:hypothetical protein
MEGVGFDAIPCQSHSRPIAHSAVHS